MLTFLNRSRTLLFVLIRIIQQVHVFHIFMPTSTISGRAFKRIGAFIREVTLRNIFTPFEVGERSILVLNSKPSQTMPFPNAKRFLEMGMKARSKTLEDLEDVFNVSSSPALDYYTQIDEKELRNW